MNVPFQAAHRLSSTPLPVAFEALTPPAFAAAERIATALNHG